MQESNAVQLRWVREPSFAVNNQSYALEERLYVTLRVPYPSPTDPQRIIYCWVNMTVDTGALFSVFPFPFYNDFQQHIQFLQSDDIALGNGLLSSASLFTVKAPGAAAIPSRFGRLRVHFSDVTCYTPAVDILAQFLPEGAAWTQPVLALGGGAIGGQRVEINTTPGEAWLHVIEIS